MTTIDTSHRTRSNVRKVVPAPAPTGGMFRATVTFTDGSTVTDTYPNHESLMRTVGFVLSGLTVRSLTIDTGRETIIPKD